MQAGSVIGSYLCLKSIAASVQALQFIVSPLVCIFVIFDDFLRFVGFLGQFFFACQNHDFCVLVMYHQSFFDSWDTFSVGEQRCDVYPLLK